MQEKSDLNFGAIRHGGCPCHCQTIVICSAGPPSVLQDHHLYCSTAICTERPPSVLQDRHLYCRTVNCTAGPSSVLQDRHLHCRTTICTAGLLSVQQNRYLYCRTTLCTAGTPSVQQDRNLYCSLQDLTLYSRTAICITGQPPKKLLCNYLAIISRNEWLSLADAKETDRVYCFFYMSERGDTWLVSRSLPNNNQQNFGKFYAKILIKLISRYSNY